MIYDTIEKAKKGYTTAELTFYNALKIQPLMLADCGFHNLARYNYEVGEDCCEYDEVGQTGECPSYCEKQEEKYPCYPTFSDNALAYYSYIINKKNITIKANTFEEYRNLLLLTIANLVNEDRLIGKELENIRNTVGIYFGRFEE